MVSAHTPPGTQAVLSPELKVARPRKNWWMVVLPFVLWQVISILVCELVLFTAGIGEEEIFKFDKQLGFRHFPDKIVTWRSEGYSRSYFNADGMREPGLTIAKPANILRVALLGDSLVESLQVPLEQTYGQLIEKNIGKIDGKQVQVVNFGNSGYSTTQECLLLEEKVFKYQPDLVILGYSSRDMMENWSPPDETLSNVRPAALKLPGHALIIDNSPVTNWLKSPRARFLQSIDWVRHHSRVWGIISATELQLSMKDPLVKSLLGFCTNPVRSSRAGLRSVNAFIASQFHPKKNDTVAAVAPVVSVSAVPAQITGASSKASVASPVLVVVSNTVPAKIGEVPQKFITHLDLPGGSATVPISAPTAVAVATPDPAEKTPYTHLVATTMGGLIDRMNTDCKSRNVKFAVAGMPCRADLSPYDGYQVTPELNYEEELSIIRKYCAADAIPFFDVNGSARPLDAKTRKSLFFSAHLAPPGHIYASSNMIPAVRKVLSGK